MRSGDRLDDAMPKSGAHSAIKRVASPRYLLVPRPNASRLCLRCSIPLRYAQKRRFASSGAQDFRFRISDQRERGFVIYFDNAATTFPKPSAVTEEVVRCLTTYCGNAGRGSHPLAMACAEVIYTCREELADFLGLGAPERIIFCSNTTHALNLALRGILRPHSHVHCPSWITTLQGVLFTR